MTPFQDEMVPGSVSGSRSDRADATNGSRGPVRDVIVWWGRWGVLPQPQRSGMMNQTKCLPINAHVMAPLGDVLHRGVVAEPRPDHPRGEGMVCVRACAPRRVNTEPPYAPVHRRRHLSGGSGDVRQCFGPARVDGGRAVNQLSWNFGRWPCSLAAPREIGGSFAFWAWLGK